MNVSQYHIDIHYIIMQKRYKKNVNGTSHAGQISSVPRTEISYLNSHVRFNCTVEAPWILTWEVDGTAARFLSARNVSFNTITTREVERSTLHIMASLINNNSEIACISVSASGQEIARAVAFLYVQGMIILLHHNIITVVSHSLFSDFHANVFNLHPRNPYKIEQIKQDCMKFGSIASV